jgi:putative membrane protein
MPDNERQIDQAPGRRARVRALAALLLFVGILGLIYVTAPGAFALWVKAFHVVAVIAWMAGLLYMPRLFVYHTDAERGSVQSETFKVMERRLYTVIMSPAMMITWVLGLYLAWDLYRFQGGWLHAKIALVILLTITHVLLGRAVRLFAVDGPRNSARYWRLMNEVPTLLMIGIVILVIVKPLQ